MLMVTCITHVAVKARDVGATLALYVDKFGFEEMFRLERDGLPWMEMSAIGRQAEVISMRGAG